MAKMFRSQSPHGASYEIDTAGGTEAVRLLKEEGGNHAKFTTAPGGEWFAVEIDFDGKIQPSKQSAGQLILAIVSTGGWSGGECYRGYAFGKPGAIVWFGCKGTQEWLVFEETGPKRSLVKPGSQPVEL